MIIKASTELEEVRWRKASASGSGGNCVEIASLGAMIAVRDSQNPAGPAHVVDRPAWAALLGAARRGEVDVSA